MDARDQGYGYAIPMPGFDESHLGEVIYIDELGFVRTMGKLSDDGHYRHLADQVQGTSEWTTTIEGHHALTVAFTTGCIEVRPLTEKEVLE